MKTNAALDTRRWERIRRVCASLPFIDEAVSRDAPQNGTDEEAEVEEETAAPTALDRPADRENQKGAVR